MSKFFSALFWTIAGIVLGEVFNNVVKIKYKKIRIYLDKKKRQKLYYGKKIHNYIKTYYGDSLYNCKIGNASLVIPFLSNDSWSNLNIDVLSNSGIMTFVATQPCSYPIHTRMIETKKKRGQNLFDNPSAFLHRIDYNNGQIAFEVGEYSYFQRISFVDDFERETYRCVYGLFGKKDILRRKFLSISSPSLISDNTIPFGCDVVFAIKFNDAYKICIHERSHTTVNYPGGYMVVPSFGFGGVKNAEENLLFFSFLREYCEELFDREEMVQEDKHINPQWFYKKYDEAMDIQSMIQSNSFSLNLIGCGFDTIGGFFNVTLLAIVSDEKIAMKIYDTCIGNWETSNHNIKFVEVDGIELEQHLLEGKLCPSSAYAISQAIPLIKKNINQNSDS